MSFEDINVYSGKEWKKIPLAQVTTYHPGWVCQSPSWWAVLDGCVLKFRNMTYQRNTNKAIVEQIHPTLQCIFLEQAYLPRGE